MKRTELKRSTKPMKRTELKRKSPMKSCWVIKSRWVKVAAEVDELREKRRIHRRLTRARRKYKKSFLSCILDCDRAPNDTHEIRGGKWRHVTVKLRQFWLPVCRKHHEEIHQTDKWPVAKQLAFKLKYDPDNFDLDFYNATLVGELPVTMAEIEKYSEGIDQ